MSDSVDVRWAEADERDAVLRFVREMGFNPRDAVTWDALGMVAMTAWRDGSLIGAIPLEPRPLRIAAGRTIRSVHETVVAVAPDWRSRGIGSAMQRAIFTEPPAGAQLVSVFREEPQSAAYRWYLKNGFRPVLHVDSWFWEPRTPPPGVGCSLYSADDPQLEWNSMKRIWSKSREMAGGFVDQAQRPLREWLRVHPYRGRYAFHVVVDRDAGDVVRGYALLGVGRMHSESERIDVLDALAVDGNMAPLLRSIEAVSAHEGWRPVRWPIGDGDPAVAVARDAGFEKRWGFDMLVRTVGAFTLTRSLLDDWRYAGVDYI